MALMVHIFSSLLVYSPCFKFLFIVCSHFRFGPSMYVQKYCIGERIPLI